LGKFYGDGDVDYPIDLSVVEDSGLDYLALGHWHGMNIYQDSTGVPRIAYSGTHEQTKYGENDAGYCLLVEIEAKGNDPIITPIRCGGLSWCTLNYEVLNSESLSDLDDLLKKNKDFDMLEINLGGNLHIDHESELKQILQYHDTLHEDFRINPSLKYSVPINKDAARDLGDPTLNLVDAELRSMLLDDNSRQQAVLVEALSLLYNLSEEASE